VDELIGADADWENPAVMFDPSKGLGQSAAAVALRVEAEELITEMGVRRPEWVAKGGAEAFSEAMHYAAQARTFLTYHAGLARHSEDRIARLLGVRDLMMAENLAYIVARERARGGKVLAFAHNMHLQRGVARWQLGPHALAWWPAGAQVDVMLGEKYRVIGVGVGVLEGQGIGRPEEGTLEGRLSAGAGAARFVATHRGRGLAEVSGLPTRSGSASNSGYFPLSAQSVGDFDGLLVLG
jgi:erythromycin esterase-like protein